MRKRTVLITGASRGLGRAMALAFAPQAGRLVLAARKPSHLAETAAEIGKTAPGCEVSAVGGDLSGRAGIDELLAGIGGQLLGEVDILINNAGWAAPAAFVEADTDGIIGTYFTDLIAPALLCRAVLGGMTARKWGRIVNISSILAVQASGPVAAYASAKAGLNSLTRCLSAEVARHGVTVNAIMPGLMLTDMGRAAVLQMGASKSGLSEAEILERVRRSMPLQKLSEVVEVAALARYLAGEEAGFITGQVIGAAGGL